MFLMTITDLSAINPKEPAKVAAEKSIDPPGNFVVFSCEISRIITIAASAWLTFVIMVLHHRIVLDFCNIDCSGVAG